MNFIINNETPSDYLQVKKVIKSAFNIEAENSEFNEWILVEKIRNSEYYINELSLVALIEGKVVGHILFTPMKINDENNSYDSLALGPVSVHKDFQNKGAGKQLIKSGIEKAKELGYKSIIVMGDPQYYTKFGFDLASKFQIGTTSDYNDEYLFALELLKGELCRVRGIIKYCPSFYDEHGELM